MQKTSLQMSLKICSPMLMLIVVTSLKKNCLDLCVQHKYVDSASNRLDALRKGFSELLICQGNEGAKEFFGNYSAEEFNKVLYGSDEPLCIEDWKENTQYEDGRTTSLFWEVATEFSEERRRDLFHGGFDGLEQKLTILVVNGSRLPAVSTCVHQLKIMAYESKEELKKDIEFAIDYSTGFFLE
ncbi:hypothetical protein MKW98_031586 [Papaver atlanticum]|uniref:HECT-type E3 ubiquitin transferase n=1 Tax=Papaver atlanticum TaxID=357466 RepID=A0AAD4X9G0_9MAGN|nr:hypothetical protein MKW98_031586 [Papaver atlanticum]